MSGDRSSYGTIAIDSDCSTGPPRYRSVMLGSRCLERRPRSARPRRRRPGFTVPASAAARWGNEAQRGQDHACSRHTRRRSGRPGGWLLSRRRSAGGAAGTHRAELGQRRVTAEPRVLGGVHRVQRDPTLSVVVQSPTEGLRQQRGPQARPRLGEVLLPQPGELVLIDVPARTCGEDANRTSSWLHRPGAAARIVYCTHATVGARGRSSGSSPVTARQSSATAMNVFV